MNEESDFFHASNAERLRTKACRLHVAVVMPSSLAGVRLRVLPIDTADRSIAARIVSSAPAAVPLSQTHSVAGITRGNRSV